MTVDYATVNAMKSFKRISLNPTVKIDAVTLVKLGA